MSDKKPELLKGEEALLLNHNYDGIHELDHPLPKWWVWKFYATIVFSIFYVGYYMMGPGPTPTQELSVQLEKIEALKPKASGSTSEELQALTFASTDANSLSLGKEVYTGKCAMCHGDLGQGVIGPNLADNYWIHGKGDLVSIAELLKVGVLEKGMPAWVEVLKPEELIQVAAYAFSLQGTNPPGAKPPQGELVPKE